MIKNSKYNEFFPYTSFRPGQEKYIDQIERSTRLEKNILLSVPNGTGKTVIVLSAVIPVALERGLKIVYLCRTRFKTRNPFRWISDWVRNEIRFAPDQKGFISKTLASFWNSV